MLGAPPSKSTRTAFACKATARRRRVVYIEAIRALNIGLGWVEETDLKLEADTDGMYGWERGTHVL